MNSRFIFVSHGVSVIFVILWLAQMLIAGTTEGKFIINYFDAYGEYWMELLISLSLGFVILYLVQYYIIIDLRGK